MKKLYFLIFLFSTPLIFSQSAGDIVITEIMQNPSEVGDTSGEYFEVYNTTGSAIDMNGWTISDNGADSHVIGSSVVVGAMSYAVFGINGDTGTNGGVTVDYVYTGINLSNSDDELVLTTGGATEIDRVEWDGGPNFPDPNGASMNLDPGALNGTDNDTGSNWCEATSSYGLGDLGTPGSANDVCGPPCDLNLTADDATCDATTAGPDPYTATLNFTGGGTSTYDVDSDVGTVDLSGGDPSVDATGTITVTGLTEGTDVTITVDNLGVGGSCDFMRTISSPNCVSVSCPSVGDIIITEIMQNPDAVGDGSGEWFEVYNTTGAPIDMEGWTVEDDGSDSFDVVGTLSVPAGGYVVFGNNADMGTNGGVSVDYEYSGMFLGNSDDEIVLKCSTTEIDRVNYDGGPNFPDPTAASMELAFDAYDDIQNDNGANWGTGSSAYGDGDLGTPGSDNDHTLSVNQFNIADFKVYPNPNNTGVLNISTPNGLAVDITVYDVLGKAYIKTTVANGSLDVSGLSAGLYIVKLAQGDNTLTKKLVIK